MKETFGQRFYRLRKAKGLTQEDIALKVNITSQAVSKWENDLTQPDISILLELSEILSVSVDELLGKEKIETVVINEKKDINKCYLKIKIVDDKDKVNINIPLALIKICLDSGLNINDYVSINVNKNAMKDIDFHKILDLVSQGVIGEIVNIESEDGETILIYVCYED